LVPSVPTGWQTGPPDFVGVGTQRSGTRWWWRLMITHPGIETAGPKERHFFDAYLDREFGAADRAAYHRLFPRPEGAITGEWTPRYMYDPWTPPLVAEAAPEAKILVLVRDPISRFRSGLGHEGRVLNRELRGGHRDHLLTMIANDELHRSLYGVQLERLLASFPEDRVLVLQYERCAADPAGELRRTYEFLGLDPEGGITELPEGRVVPANPHSDLPAHVEEAVRQAIARDLESLRGRFGLDQGLWPSFDDQVSIDVDPSPPRQPEASD
jgi:Sulfotransferase family